jgi:Tol biopolymer transport system component
MNHKRVLFLVTFIAVLIPAIAGQTSPEYKVLFEKARFTMETKGDLNGAITLFNNIIKKYPKEREYAAKSQLYIGQCYEKLGVTEARKAYQKVISSYPEQTEAVRLANEKLSILKRTEIIAEKDNKEKRETSNQLTLKKLNYPQLSYPYAEISPDGKKIAYYIAGQTKQGIGILDPASGTAKVIIESGAGGQASKVWSPQSDKIAYRLNDNEIHICDINGAKPQLFYKSPEYKLYPTDWSKDGKKIVCFFEAKDRTLRIGTITADGQVRVLASGNQTEFVSEPKFSPDGNYIAFSRKDEKGNSDIFILASDGSNTESVAPHPGRDECPVWSPDGKNLLFLSDRNRSADLWGIWINQGKTAGAPFIIKRDLGWRTLVQDLTADGKLFMFTQSGNEPGNLFTILLDKGKGSFDETVTPVSVYPTDHSFPRYSPDGKMIAYLSRRGQIGYPKLFVMDEKGVERELSLQGHYATNIAWHPENNTLFFTGWDKTQKTGVFEVSLAKEDIKLVYSSDTVDMKTGKGRLVNINLIPKAGKIMFFKLLEGGYVEILSCMPDGLNPAVVIPRVKIPVWGLPSPDGYKICYPSGDSLMVISVSDGIPRHIGSSTLNLEAAWAPNSEKLMFREGNNLRVFSVKGNTSITLYQAPAGKTIGGMEMYANAWSPNGGRFIFTERDTSVLSTSPQRLIMINPEDRSVSNYGEAPEGYRLTELRWSPDGSRVLATGKSTGSTGAPRYEYWILENFLPR